VGVEDARISEVVQRERCVLVTLDVDFWDIRAYPPDASPPRRWEVAVGYG
jgi:hypothetical protein